MDCIETQKGSYEQVCNRKIASVEDLFETQRKELFGRIAEVEKGLTSQYAGLTRAV